ncbi:hypothetical protein DTL42_08550 [Bremerella cremea]|uniref:Uncharacterized protein n=1 Tax=Bremerella cremea TaxID=1031537 RepID=A0A368KWX3_9BACT|nr:hypothetical protein [Bremerella cremea]RCS52869.1 hypothetical protein DTL42_08550 [Bremerella cremea]
MDNRPTRWGQLLRFAAGGLVLAIAAGWAIDHRKQQQQLEPIRKQWSEKHAEFNHLRDQLLLDEALQRFESWQQIVFVIDNIDHFQLFERLARKLERADDAVFTEAVPKLITMLDDPQELHRQRAWRLLQCAKESPRFAPFESSYQEGVVALLRHPSIRGYSKLLPWLGKQKLNSPEVLAGLRERMMDDRDPFAPHAAYTLAELDPTADIGPRLLQLIELKHSQWQSILHRLPKYLPKEEAQAIFEKYHNLP